MATARKWQVKNRGAGFVLVHRDHYGYVFTIDPTDEENGDPIQMVRAYMALNGKPGDLYYEGRRPFLFLRGVLE